MSTRQKEPRCRAVSGGVTTHIDGLAISADSFVANEVSSIRIHCCKDFATRFPEQIDRVRHPKKRMIELSMRTIDSRLAKFGRAVEAELGAK